MRLAAPLLSTLLAALLAFPAAAHDRGGGVEGDGKPTTATREVPPFQAIRLDAAADVSVRVGAAPSVTVTVDGNLQQHLRTDVEGAVLVVRASTRIRPRGGVKVAVTTPELRRLDLRGSGDVAIEGGSGPLELAIEGSGDLRWRGEATSLHASIEGSGDVRLEGRAARLRVEVDGSGDVDASRLAATDVEASVRGSGDVEVSLAGGSLSASVAGSGDIHWRGEGRVERVAVTGSGEISRRD
jgi:hypothetical protein